MCALHTHAHTKTIDEIKFLERSSDVRCNEHQMQFQSEISLYVCELKRWVKKHHIQNENKDNYQDNLFRQMVKLAF